MRLFAFPLLLCVLIGTARQLPNSFDPKPIGDGSSAFLLTKSENANGFEIVRRLANDFVIIRNDSRVRVESANFFEINDDWKWADQYPSNSNGRFLIRTSIDISPQLHNVKVLSFDGKNQIQEIEGSLRQIRKEVLGLATVTFIQKKSREPQEESQLREHNLGINGIRNVHSSKPSLDGNTISVSVKEGAFDTLDIDIRTRAIRDELSSLSGTGHATDMATVLGGAGNSFINGRGVAKGASIYSETFDNLLPATTSQLNAREITVQNHSYGVGIENFYGLESVAFDQQALDITSLLHVFSAGNSGSLTGSGTYNGLSRYGTITGSFKQAKNVLLVTSTNDFGNVMTANSAGPAFDGRIKPDLSAYGEGGTSDAAALVSGSVALIQEQWRIVNNELPTGDMLKALLIAGVEDLNEPGPDYFGGYGNLNLRKSIDIIDHDWWFHGAITNGQMITHQVSIEQPIHQLTVVLSWRDPAGNDGDAIALVNDIDMVINQDTESWSPWILNPTPNLTALATPATKGADHLNNMEVIRIESPALGQYDIEIHGFDISGNQQYSIAYYMEAQDDFIWNYPTSIDPQVSASEVVVYFDQTFQTSGIVQMDDLSDNWTTIGSINPGDNFATLSLPEIDSDVVIKAIFGLDEFKSDTFHIGTKPELKVALLCDDELVIKWEALEENATYEVLYYDDGKLNSLITTTDTFAIVDREEINSLHFTVRQLGEFADGLPDETVRVDQQAVGCYLNTFLVSLDVFEVVNLQVNLSLPFAIETLRILKVDPKDSIVYKEINPTNEFHTFSDSQLVPGMTSYYAQLITESGLEIISERFDVFSTDDKKYILFPNPVTDGFLNLLTPEPNAVFQVLQLDGRPLVDFLMTSKFESFPIELSKGTYLYRVIKNGKTLKSGKFVVGS